jgi:hypothetical protein
MYWTYIYYVYPFDLRTYTSLVVTNHYATLTNRPKEKASICPHLKAAKSKKGLSRAERLNIHINYPLTDIIIGLLLGHGHIQQRPANNSRFMYAQTSLRLNHLNSFSHIFIYSNPI